MNVWMQKVSGVVGCQGCRKPITPVALVAKLDGKKVLWHPNCWTAHSIAMVSGGKGRGRQPLPINADIRAKRLSVLRVYSVYNNRLSHVELELCVDPKNEYLQRRAQRLRDRLELCRLEIEEYGGAPRSWAC